VEFAAHLVQAWMCEGHTGCLLAHLSRGTSLLNQRALGGFDKKLSVLDGCILQNAVAEIEDVAMAGKRIDGCQCHIANFFGRGKQDGGVDIALESNFWTERLANVSEIEPPIDAEGVGA